MLSFWAVASARSAHAAAGGGIGHRPIRMLRSNAFRLTVTGCSGWLGRSSSFAGQKAIGHPPVARRSPRLATVIA